MLEEVRDSLVAARSLNTTAQESASEAVLTQKAKNEKAEEKAMDPESLLKQIEAGKKDILETIQYYNNYLSQKKEEHKNSATMDETIAPMLVMTSTVEKSAMKDSDNSTTNTTTTTNTTNVTVISLGTGLNAEMFGDAPLSDYLLAAANTSSTTISECLNDCSSNGICYNQTCYCRNGFLSADCSVLESSVNSKGIKIEEAIKIAGGVLVCGFFVGNLNWFSVLLHSLCVLGLCIIFIMMRKVEEADYKDIEPVKNEAVEEEVD